MRVSVVMIVEVDPDVWVEAYGLADVDLAEDVRRYVGGLVATGEAARRKAVLGVDVRPRPGPMADGS